jgi:hypothetical protein
LNFFRKILGNFNVSNSSQNIKSQQKLDPADLVDLVFNDFKFPTDIYSANKTIFGCLFYQSGPFLLWKSDQIELPESLEIITKIPCQFLMLRYWFWFISSNHGVVASSMLRDEFNNFVRQIEDKDTNFLSSLDYYFDQIDSAIDLHQSTDEKNKTLITDAGEKIELPWEYIFAMHVLLFSEDSKYFNSDGKNFDGNEVKVMECLLHSRFIAEATFKKFKANYIDFDAKKLQTWVWKTNPGLYEQHLIRRHNSIYFIETSRHVDASDVYFARCKDSEEWQGYYSSYLRLKKEILDDEAPINYRDFIASKREELDEVIDSVDRLGVGAKGLDIELMNLRDSLIGIHKYIFEETKNTEGLRLLDIAENHYKEASRKNRPHFINVIGHKSLPPEDVISALLVLDKENLKITISHMESVEDAITNLRTGCLDFVRSHLNYFEDLTEVKEKLKIIGVTL